MKIGQSRLLAVVAVLFSACVGISRGAFGAEPLLPGCSTPEFASIKFEHARGADLQAICDLAREKLGFELHLADMQALIDTAVIASLEAGKHHFLLPPIAAAAWVIDITKLRGLDGDPDGFRRTAALINKVDYGTDGVVSPGVLLLQLIASGPLAKTMSDDGLINFAAAVSIEEMNKLSNSSIDIQQPFFAAGSGKWSVAGYSFKQGRLNNCVLSRADESGALDGSNTFSNAVLVAFDNGELHMFRLLSVVTTLPEGSKVPVTIAFEKGKTLKGTGVVAQQRLGVLLTTSDDPSATFVGEFKSRKALKISVARRNGASVTIALDGAADALDVQMACFKAIPERAMAVAKAALP